jgi:hypothetical protein
VAYLVADLTREARFAIFGRFRLSRIAARTHESWRIDVVFIELVRVAASKEIL